MHTNVIAMDYVRDAEILGRIVHHKIHLNSKNIYNPNLTMSFDNLELLCQDCHNKEHFASSDFDLDGEVKDNGKNILELAGVYKK